MARYNVNIPFAGFVNVSVEAEDEESAIEVGIERASEGLRIDTRDGVEVIEYDYFHDIARGNVFYAPLNSANADLEEDGPATAPADGDKGDASK